MKRYRYQMHAHTYPCSACANMTPKELVEGLHAGGYSGGVITNHFYHGNSGIDRSLTWDEFIRQYELDYIACRKEAQKYDLDLIFGIEEVVADGLEILCYGLTPEVLYKNPELIECDYKLWYRIMHEKDVLCVQAHPFRERYYIPNPGVLPLEFIDGIEVYNAANFKKNNLEAEKYAKAHPELIVISGADAHYEQEACVGGIEVKKRIRNGKELVEVLKSREYVLIK